MQERELQQKPITQTQNEIIKFSLFRVGIVKIIFTNFD